VKIGLGRGVVDVELTRNRERAFVSTEFKEYNPRVELHVAKFIEILKNKGGAEVDASKMLDNLVFDM
jgi:hypothetical protein